LYSTVQHSRRRLRKKWGSASPALLQDWVSFKIGVNNEAEGELLNNSLLQISENSTIPEKECMLCEKLEKVGGTKLFVSYSSVQLIRNRSCALTD